MALTPGVILSPFAALRAGSAKEACLRMASFAPLRMTRAARMTNVLAAGVVMLSWLHPQSHIVPHCGHTNARLRIHLGVRTPPGASIRVHDRVLTWKEGECLVFDDSFEHEVKHGALYVGSPETVAQKIAANLTALSATRFDLKYAMGGLSQGALMTNIELYGTQVAPRVRELLA